MASKANKRARTNIGVAFTSTTAETNQNPRPNSINGWPKKHEKDLIKINRRWDKVPKEILTSADVEGRDLLGVWDDYNSLYYNEWKRVKLEQTRIVDVHTMMSLGIHDEVMRLVKNAGLGHIAYRHYPLYPDFVRQFFASLRVFYTEADSDEHNSQARKGLLSFMVRGQRYKVSFRELCEIYGFEKPDHQSSTLPTDFPGQRDFWTRFGTGVYDSKSSTQTDIRHPALRYLARIFSGTLLCRNEQNKMRQSELVLLYLALWRDIERQPVFDIGINMGGVFALHLQSLQRTPFTMTSGSKAVTIGSLLTPIFTHCGVDFTDYTSRSAPCTMDIAYLTRATWLKPERMWIFRDASRVQHLVRLPIPALASSEIDPSVLSFEPDETLLHSAAASRRQPTRSARAASSSRVPEPLPGFPETPEFPMDQETFQRSIFQSLQAIWQRMTRGCVRPRSRSPPPARSPSPALAEDVEEPAEDEA